MHNHCQKNLTKYQSQPNPHEGMNQSMFAYIVQMIEMLHPNPTRKLHTQGKTQPLKKSNTFRSSWLLGSQSHVFSKPACSLCFHIYFRLEPINYLWLLMLLLFACSPTETDAERRNREESGCHAFTLKDKLPRQHAQATIVEQAK